MNNYDQKHDRFWQMRGSEGEQKVYRGTEKCEPPLSGCKYPYAKETEFFFETSIRTLLKSYASRGKVDIFITYEDASQSQVSVRYHAGIAGEYLKYLQQMETEFGLENDIRVSSLARFPEVFTMEEQAEDEDKLWNGLKEALEGAFRQFVETRTAEGENLKKDLLEKPVLS